MFLCWDTAFKATSSHGLWYGTRPKQSRFDCRQHFSIHFIKHTIQLSILLQQCYNVIDGTPFALLEMNRRSTTKMWMWKKKEKKKEVSDFPWHRVMRIQFHFNIDFLKPLRLLHIDHPLHTAQIPLLRSPQNKILNYCFLKMKFHGHVLHPLHRYWMDILAANQEL